MQIKKIISRSISVLVFLIFAAGIFVFVTVLISKTHGVPDFLGYSFLNVSTSSMVPTYPVGTVVITKKVEAGEIKAGDVISFYSSDPEIKGIPNTHRIVSIQKDKEGKIYYITKGDNNSEADKFPVYPKDLIGKVEGSIGSVGKILDKLQNRYVMFFLLIVPLVIIVLFELKNMAKLIKHGDEGDKPEIGTNPKNEE